MAITSDKDSASPFLPTFPGHYYYDPTIYEQEQEKVFSTMWVYGGIANALPEPGDYKVVSAGKESVLVVRNQRRELQAFLNVCMHRGTRLCQETRGHLKGSVQCPYHAWTYGLDGHFLGAPYLPALDASQRAACSLTPVALEIWEGMIWLNLSSSPSALLDQLNDPIVAEFGENGPLARYGLANLKVARTVHYEIAANWKVYMENLLECYHCSIIHPEFNALLPKAFLDGSGSACLAEDAEAFTVTGKASRPPLPGLLPEDCRRYYGFFAMPNVFMHMLNDHISLEALYPLTPTSTLLVNEWLFDAEVMAREDFDPMDTVEIHDRTTRQDIRMCEAVQQGITSKVFVQGGKYAPLEHHVRLFVDYILAKLE